MFLAIPQLITNLQKRIRSLPNKNAGGLAQAKSNPIAGPIQCNHQPLGAGPTHAAVRYKSNQITSSTKQPGRSARPGSTARQPARSAVQPMRQLTPTSSLNPKFGGSPSGVATGRLAQAESITPQM